MGWRWAFERLATQTSVFMVAVLPPFNQQTAIYLKCLHRLNCKTNVIMCRRLLRVGRVYSLHRVRGGLEMARITPESNCHTDVFSFNLTRASPPSILSRCLWHDVYFFCFVVPRRRSRAPSTPSDYCENDFRGDECEIGWSNMCDNIFSFRFCCRWRTNNQNRFTWESYAVRIGSSWLCVKLLGQTDICETFIINFPLGQRPLRCSMFTQKG